MAIIENRSTEVGDVILIEADVPLIGIIALTDFIDTTLGETLDNFFTREFRYSIDGVNYTDWIELTISNIESIEIDSRDTLFIEYRYTHDGDPSVSGSLAFVDATLYGDFTSLSCGDAYVNSMLKEFVGDCNNICSLGWAINVLEKLYKEGLLAKFMERDRSSNTAEDRDFIDYWRTITHYFALYVCLARSFKSYGTEEALLREFLRQRGLFFCSSTSLEDLLYLKSSFYDEYRQRGTIQIVRKKNSVQGVDESLDLSLSGSLSTSLSESELLKEVNGELLRLICYQADCDEFIFNLRRPEEAGWTLGQSSPLYLGTLAMNGANKAYETSSDIGPLSQYPLLNLTYIDRVEELGRTSMRIQNVPAGEVAGIGSIATLSQRIPVDSALSYELTFAVRQVGIDNSVSASSSVSAPIEGNLTCGVFIFDEAGVALDCLNFDSIAQSTFFEKQALNREDMYYDIRCILYRNGGTGERWLDIGFGENLILPEGACTLVPYIVLDNEDGIGGEIYLHNIKLRPLGLDYPIAFVGTANWIDVWMKNRNDELTTRKLEQTMRRYLLPYNSVFKNIYIPTT